MKLIYLGVKIFFNPRSVEAELSVPSPSPAKNYIPQWFKDIPQFDLNDKGTAKLCMPFFDSFTSGYIQELWCDLYIENINGKVSYSWAGDIRPVSSRSENNYINNMPHFHGYYDQEFHWNTQWEPDTPKGWSTFYSHPNNRHDLPFTTFFGIIDTDKYSHTGPLPFIIKEGFTGLIPAGTPIYQLNFIKRESWTKNINSFDYYKMWSRKQNIKKFFVKGYKKTAWSRKNFE
jgi:hypothetical protein